VKRCSFYIDGQLASVDSNSSDGWGVVLSIDNFSAGNHMLKVVAEDYSGNTSAKEYGFTSLSPFVEPKVIINSPKDGETVGDNILVSGQVLGTIDNIVHTISYFIDDAILAEGELETSGQFTKEIDFNKVKSGTHIIKAAIYSNDGQEYFSQLQIVMAGKAEIASPLNKIYGHSETMPVIFLANFDGATLKIDGKPILNNSQIKLMELSLGDHLVSVEKNNKIITRVQFSVNTSCADLLVIIRQLYKENKIASTVYFGVLDMATNAKTFESKGDIRTRNAYLKIAVNFITSMSMRGMIPKSSAGLIINDSTSIINSIRI